jgi:hypothetical protein
VYLKYIKRKEARKKRMNQTNKGKKNIPVYEPSDIQMTDTLTKVLSFLYNVNFLSEQFIYITER